MVDRAVSASTGMHTRGRAGGDEARPVSHGRPGSPRRAWGEAMSGSRLRPYLGPVIALLVVLALGAGTVYAAIPNGNGKYYACYVKNTGVVRLINYPKVSTCPQGEKLISWNAKGPQGPVGATGPVGPVGPKGDPGPAGAAGITKITSRRSTPTSACPPIPPEQVSPSPATPERSWAEASTSQTHLRPNSPSLTPTRTP